jgi:HK97 family phage major capsid protein
MKTLTVLPFLLSLFIAVAAMPTDIFQICAWNVGTVKTEPWRSRVAAGAARAVSVLRTWFAQMCSHPLLAGEAGNVAFDLLLPAQRVQALLQRGTEITNENGKLDAALASRGVTGTFTEEERTKLTQLRTARKDNDEAVAEARAEVERQKNAQAVPDPDAQAHAAAAGKAGLEVGKDLAEADPKRGFVKGHREFLGAVMDFYRFGKMDARLKPLFRTTAGSDEQGNYSDPHGGFLQPVAFSPDVLSLKGEADPTVGLTRNLPMTAPSVLVDARVDKDHSSSVSGGLRVYRHSETTALTASRVETEKLRFTAEELIGLAHATESQVSDSPATFIAMVADGFRDEFAGKILSEKIRGTGAAGQYLGVLNSPAKITVAKETGQKADTILKENIDKMEARIWGPDMSDRIGYLASKTTFPQLASLVQVVGTGGNAVPYLTVDAQGRRRLNTRLIFFTEFASALGDEGDLMLVNWYEYLEGLYQSLQQAESVHVRFENHERSFKWWVRNCGMPWWRTALTPKYGSTLSPIVTLADRA